MIPKTEPIELYELFISDPENPELGLLTMGFVDRPAIEVYGGKESVYFSSHQEFIEPQSGESKDEFISRCIKVQISEGKSQEQAIAICLSVASEKFENDLPEFKDLEETLLFLAGQLGEAKSEDYKFATSQIENFGKTDYQSVEMASAPYVRFQYTGDILPTSREFCVKMMQLDRLYTREEIDTMSGVVGKYIPRPAGSPVDLFTYKGGANCQHHWVEVTLENVENRARVVSVKRADGLAGEINPPAVHMSSQFKFINEEQGIVIAPFMIPDLRIPRIDKNGKRFDCFYSKETIRHCLESYMKNLRINNGNIMHDPNKKTDVTLLEAWVVEDSKIDKSALHGFELPVGSAVAMYRINDMQLRKDFREGKIRGLSIEGEFNVRRVA